MLSTSRCGEGPGGGTCWHKHVSERGPAGTLVSLESKGERGEAERLGGVGGAAGYAAVGGLPPRARDWKTTANISPLLKLGYRRFTMLH